MAERERIAAIPQNIRADLNFEMRDRELAMLDNNARFIVRRMVGRAYVRGFDDGWIAGQDDARTDRDIEHDREPVTPTENGENR